MHTIRRRLAGPWIPPDHGKAPYLWAFSLSFFYWKYLYVNPAPLELALALLTGVVFLPIYFASYWFDGARKVLAVLATCLIGALWAPENSFAGTFYIFAAGMCAGLAGPRRAYLGLGAVMALALLVAAALALACTTAATRFLIPVLAIGLRPAGWYRRRDGVDAAALARAAAAQAGRSRAHGHHRRARTHFARPARPAGAHLVADHAQGRIGGQAGRPRQ
jgi:hypothetical protein